jgi:phenylacetate-coenzyme A ligase PaaK-like adenylate-forming protein
MFLEHLRDSGVGDVAAIGELPFTTKAELKRRVEKFAEGKNRTHYFVGRTSGSSGFWTEMWFEQIYFVSYFARLAWCLRSAGIEPAAGSVGIVDLTYNPTAKLWAFPMPCLGDSRYETLNIHPGKWPSTREPLEQLNALAPAVIHTVPSCLDVLLRYHDEHRDVPRCRPQLIRCVAEPLLAHTRERVAAQFGCPVLSTYGLTEIGGVIAEECTSARGFHVNQLDYFVEIIDRDGRVVPDGVTGEIVITNLYNRTVPIIRYRTGDFGALTRERCACGRIGARIVELVGRTIALFTLPDGTSYNPYFEFNEFFRAFPCSQFQLVQESLREIVLRYVASADLDGSPLVTELTHRMVAKYGGELAFRVERVPGFDIERKLHSFLNKVALRDNLVLLKDPSITVGERTC